MADFNDSFTSGTNQDLTTYNPDYAYIRGSGLQVNSASGHVRDAAESGNDIWAIYNGTGAPTGNQRCAATVLSSNTGQAQGFVFVLGVGGGSPNGYNLWRESGSVYRVYRLDNGAFPQIGADISVTTPAGTPYTIALEATIEASQTVLTYNINGTIGTRVDSSGSRRTTGRPGIGVYNPGAGPGNAAVDDLDIDDLSANAYTLTCESGSFGLTGSSVDLVYSGTDPILACDAGSFVFTGATADFQRGRRLEASAGSFALTGDEMLVDVSIACDSGSFALSGSDVTLIDSGSAAVLSCDAGSFTLTGAGVALEVGRALVADAGSFSLSGVDIGFPRGWNLIADAGSFSLTGTDVSLQRGPTLVAEGGSFSVSGTDANLLFGHRLDCGVGSYTLTGSEVTLTPSGADPVLGCEAGSFTWTGADVTFPRQYVLGADGASFSLTGTDVDFRRGVPGLVCDAGAFSVTGDDLSFLRGYALIPESGSFVLTGADVALVWSAAFVPIGGGRTRVGGSRAATTGGRVGR